MSETNPPFNKFLLVKNVSDTHVEACFLYVYMARSFLDEEDL
jgi:hypothetical protein